MTSPIRSNTPDNSSRPSVIGKESFETIPENDVPQEVEVMQETRVDGAEEYSAESSSIGQDHEMVKREPKLTNGGADTRYSMIAATWDHRDLPENVDSTWV